MLDQTFGRVYTKFKLHFYKQIFSRFEDSYLHLVMERAKQRFGPDDLAKLEEMLQVVSDELMPEIQLPE